MNYIKLHKYIISFIDVTVSSNIILWFFFFCFIELRIKFSWDQCEIIGLLDGLILLVGRDTIGVKWLDGLVASVKATNILVVWALPDSLSCLISHSWSTKDSLIRSIVLRRVQISLLSVIVSDGDVRSRSSHTRSWNSVALSREV